MNNYMNSMQKLNSAIEEFRLKNGQDYNEILVSKTFYLRLHNESKEKETLYTESKLVSIGSTIIGIPKMEIVEDLSQDFIIR